jgi:hypothetical protein
MERLVWIAQTKFDCGPSKPPRPGGLGPLDVVKSVKELAEKLVRSRSTLACLVVSACCLAVRGGGGNLFVRGVEVSSSSHSKTLC